MNITEKFKDAFQFNMSMREIIKDAFLFPSKNMERFAIYLILSVLMTVFIIGGTLKYPLGFFNADNYLIGGIYLVIAMVIGFFISGYHIKVIKSGIELDDEVPAFEWGENFLGGFEIAVVSTLYFIIQAFIIAVAALATNVFGNAIAIVQEIFSQIFNVFLMVNSIDIAVNAISTAVFNFVISLAITLAVALIVFLIFSILQSASQARLANTGSLKDALDIFEAAKDIKRIGIVKVLLLVLLVLVIIAVMAVVFIILFQYLPLLLTVIYIILSPYIALAIQRLIGLAYSDIA